MEFWESGLHFRFAEGWVAKKYDAHRFYQGLSGRGLKGVDFVAFDGKSLLLLEVKNYNQLLPAHADIDAQLLPSPELLAQEIARKVEDTLLGIDAIGQYYHRKFFFRLLKPALQRLPASHHDWQFWECAYRLMQNPDCVHALLWLEADELGPAFRRTLRESLSEALENSAGQVGVASRESNQIAETVRVD